MIGWECTKILPFSDCTYTDLHGWDYPYVNVGSIWHIISENDDLSVNLNCGYSAIGVSRRVFLEHFTET